jgi:hypothetical protein
VQVADGSVKHMPLVAASGFERLPQDHVNRWLQLRDLVESRLGNCIDTNNGGYQTFGLLEYVQISSFAADELRI